MTHKIIRLTKRDCIIASLLINGFRMIETRSKRYAAFAHNEHRDGIFFVGRSAALRVGRSASKNMPVHDLTREEMIRDGSSFLLAEQVTRAQIDAVYDRMRW